MFNFPEAYTWWLLGSWFYFLVWGDGLFKADFRDQTCDYETIFFFNSCLAYSLKWDVSVFV